MEHFHGVPCREKTHKLASGKGDRRSDWFFIKMGFPNKGYLFGGPYNKDCSILGSILGSPHFGKLPYMYMYIYIHIYTVNPRFVQHNCIQVS